MQTDDLENQGSNHTSLLKYRYYPAQTSYRHFTMPVREKGNCGKEVVKGGLLSKLATSSPFQLQADQVTTSSDSSSSYNATSEKAHQNGHSHQQTMDRVITSPISLPVFKAPVQPHTNGHTNGHSNGKVHHAGLSSKNLNPSPVIATTPPKIWGVHHNVSWLYDQETRRLSVATATTKHRTTVGDVLHFFGYMAGATTIVSLYMIIPLMILLNAVLPNSWNKLLIALGISVIVEFIICIILAKTTPRSKRKKEKVLVQP